MSEGLVVTPSHIPHSSPVAISLTSAVSRKKSIPAPCGGPSAGSLGRCRFSVDRVGRRLVATGIVGERRVGGQALAALLLAFGHRRRGDQAVLALEVHHLHADRA